MHFIANFNYFAEFKKFSILGHAHSNAIEMLSDEVGTLVHADLSTCIGFTCTNSLTVEI